MLHLKARQNPNQWMIAAPFKCHLKNSVVMTSAPWEGAGANCCPRPPRPPQL